MNGMFTVSLSQCYRADLRWNRVPHAIIGQEVGLTTKQLSAIRNVSTALSNNVDPNHVLSDLQRAALIYTDWSTRNVHIPQEVFDKLKSFLDDKQIVEATLTVGAYNMVSRFLVAVDVGDKANVKVPEPSDE